MLGIEPFQSLTTTNHGDFFEILLECAKRLAGFKHDEGRPPLSDDSCQVFEAQEAPHAKERNWWKFW